MTTVASRLATSRTLVSLRPAALATHHLLWRLRGSRGPASHRLKQGLVRGHARRYRLGVFVETGTYLGDMVWAVRHQFGEIHSVELDHELWRRARDRFAGCPNVHVHEGDSARVLPGLLDVVGEPALFWLDGHASGGITASGDRSTPILDELDRLLSRQRRGDVVLIDDASLFTGEGGYPSLGEIEELVRGRPDLSVRSDAHVIRILPAGD